MTEAMAWRQAGDHFRVVQPPPRREKCAAHFLPMSGFLCIGHRGACGHEPENTLRSVRRALELGAHGIEIDVHYVHGELLVIHDAKLERTTNGRGYISRKSLADLRALDAGQGERIPTLREVFETVNRAA